MRFVLMALALACGSVRAEIYQPGTSYLWVESRVVQLASVDDVTRPVFIWASYEQSTWGDVTIDVQAGDAFATVTAARLEAVPMSAGVSAFLSAYQTVPLAPQQFNVRSVLKPGLYHLILTYTIGAETGEWSVPYLVDYGIQPSWVLFPDSAVNSVETPLYTQAAPIVSYTITGALFMALVFLTVRKFRDMGRTI